MWELEKKALTFLLVTSITSFHHCYGINLNLTESCSASLAKSCLLNDISASYDNPLFVVNSTQSQLEELIIRDTVVVRFPYEILEQAPNLHTFIMHKCGLNRISSHHFKSALTLRTLVLQGNRLSDIPEKVFYDVPTLMELVLSQNNMHMVHKSAFVGLTELLYLDLHQNAIDQLNERLFSPLTKLQYLDLSSNEISKIDSSIFATNVNLKTLLLNNNKFIVFEPNSLQHLTHLHLLDVSNNFVEELNIQSADTVYAQNSSLKRCSIKGGVIKFHASNNELTELDIGEKSTVRELVLHGNLFQSLDSFGEMANLQHLDLSKNHIASLNNSRYSRVLSFPNLNHMNLAFNKLKNLTVENFLVLSKLTHLDLAFNNLGKLRANIFDPLGKLEKLYIDGNALHSFDYEEFLDTHPSLREVGLNANSWDAYVFHPMLYAFEKHSVQLSHHYPVGVEMFPKTANPVGRYKAPATHSAVKEVCQCSSLSSDIMAPVTFIMVFLIFVFEIFRIMHAKNCVSLCWRRSTSRLGQQWLTEPLNESVSEV